MKKFLAVMFLMLGLIFVSGCQTKLDEVDQKVNQAIGDFLENHTEVYVSNEYVNETVLASVYQLDPKDKGNQYKNLLSDSMPVNRSSSYGLLNTLVYEFVLGKNINESKTALESMTTTNVYEAVTLLNLFTMANVSSVKINEVKTLILETDPSMMDADYAGMAMLSLSPYAKEDDVKNYLEDLKTFIVSNLSKDGVVSWGNANSSTTATVIIGLVSIGENPRDEMYTIDDVDLIEALLSYEKNGGFYWLQGDTDLDLNFSTPQAFAALAVYKIFRESNKKINLYDIS